MASYLTDDEVSSKAYDHSLMKRLLAYVRPYVGLFSLAFLLSILVTVAMVIGPFIVRDFIESIRGESSGGPGMFAQLAAWLAGGAYPQSDATQPWLLTGTTTGDMQSSSR